MTELLSPYVNHRMHRTTSRSMASDSSKMESRSPPHTSPDATRLSLLN